MLTLAIDTSTDMLCCALGEWSPTEKFELLAQLDHPARRRSNVELVTTIHKILARANKQMQDIEAIIAGRGPGSFTGVRIGVATAKGLACALEVPLYGSSALDACAWNVWGSGVRGTLAVAADAMRGEVYPGIYTLNDAGAQRCFAAETVQKLDACVNAWACRGDADELILAGDGLFKYRQKFEDAGFVRFTDESLWHPSAEGLMHACTGGAGDPALVLPIYTRLSDAEEAERERLGLGLPQNVATTGVSDELADIHLQLRPMSVNDLDQVAELEQRAFAEGIHKAFTKEMFFEELNQPGRSWWVAHDRGGIVGFAGALLAGERFEIIDIAVDANRRRENIGKQLIQRLANDAHVLNAQELSLEVYAQNNAALSLYESLGFTCVGKRCNYYGPRNDALIMSVALPLAKPLENVGQAEQTLRVWPPARKPKSESESETIQSAAPLILAIESSCDETAVAVIDGKGTVLSSVVATQIDFHARFGGVVPEIASRKHTEAIVSTFEEALGQAGDALGCAPLTPADLSAIAVTAGPGLVGALVVGVAFAKGLAAGLDLPLIAVNHLEGHLFANLFETPELKPPFVASLVSGGNTMLVHVRAWGDYEILGTTIDDAVGEAFDKVAKALGLGYPGGPVISRLAAEGNPRAIDFPRAMMHSHDYRFSLSGLKTAVITHIEGENIAGRPVNLPDLAASFQAAVIDVQVAKAVTAVEETGVSDFCVGGGVAANPALRAAYQEAFTRMGVRVTVPPLAVCGDNAAMIALVALRSWRAHAFAKLDLDAEPNASLGTWAVKGDAR